MKHFPCAFCGRSITAEEGHYQPTKTTHHGTATQVFACHYHDERYRR